MRSYFNITLGHVQFGHLLKEMHTHIPSVMHRLYNFIHLILQDTEHLQYFQS